MAAAPAPAASTKPANGADKKKADTAEKPKLSANGYIIAILRMRESAKPREEKLLERVAPEEREAAKARLAKLDAQ